MASIFHKLASEQTPESKPKSIFHEIAESSKKERSTLEHIKHIPEYVAEGGYGAVVGAPRTISGAMEFASKFPNKKRFISAALAKPEKFLEKIGFPTQEETTKQAQKRTGTSEFEEHPIQKGATTAGSILGSSALTPGASFGSVAKAGITGLAALGGGLGAGVEGGSAGEIAGAIGLPSLVTAMAALKTGKFSPPTKQLRQLYEEGKSLGLTDKELAPLLQTRFKKKLFGKLASRTEKAEQLIGEKGHIEGALGNLYENLKNSTKKLSRATQDQEERLFHSFGDVINDLRLSKMPDDEKLKAISRIEKMKNDIIENGISAPEIVATWQDINKSINWNSFKGGQKSLAAIKKPLSDIFGELSPKYRKEFETLNKLWGNLRDASSNINKNQFEGLLTLGKVGALGTGLINLISHGDPKLLLQTVGGIVTYKGAQLLATEMLTNPRLNNLIKKTVAGLASNSKKTQAFYLNKFLDELKNYPEISREIDINSRTTQQ